MAELVPQNIPILTTNAIASYDFIDLTSGLGFRIFYPGVAVDTGASRYGLLTQTLFSRVLETTSSTTLDFDTSVFNAPGTIKGTAYLQVPFRADNANSVLITAQIKKINVAAAVSNISSVITSDTFVGTPTTTSGVFLLEIPLTQTTIGVGEKVRLEIVTTVAGGGTQGIAHDPAGRSSSSYSVTTNAKLALPFRIYN